LLNKEYDDEHGPTPRFAVPVEVEDLTRKFIFMSIVYFLIAGSLAIVMRLVQSGVIVIAGNPIQTFGLFYSSLTVHGQLMFFGFVSMLVVGLSYYLLCKFAKKPLYSNNLAIASFSLLNAGAVLLIVAGLMFFGGGWYNLMPLAFHPGNGGWNMLSAGIFLTADLLIGIALTVFSINVIATVLKGKIAVAPPTAWTNNEEQKGAPLGLSQKAKRKDGEQEGSSSYYNNDDDDEQKSRADENDGARADVLRSQNVIASLRWMSLLGLSAWLPKRYRDKIPVPSVVVVGVFVNALVQLVGNMGLFAQLYVGFSYLANPTVGATNWLLTKDFWWFFGHPIVYFTLFAFLGAAYYYIPRYAQKTVNYDRWAYRTWPFYFVFTLLVFSHHVFMDMPNPVWLQNISQFASFGIAFPSGLTIMTIMMYIFRSRIRWNITSLFILAGVAGWAFGGFAGVETGWWGADVYLHNTLNIVGHIHLVILMGSVLMGLGLIYAVLPDLVIKRRMNRELGMLHLFLTLIGGFGLALMFLFLGMAGFVRREAAIPPEFAWSMPWLMFFALTVGFAQLIFAYNLFKSLLRRHAVAAHEVERAQGIEANAEKEDVHAPYRWGDSVA